MVCLRSQRRDCRGRSGNALTLAVDDTIYHFRNDPARISHTIFFHDVRKSRFDGPRRSIESGRKRQLRADSGYRAPGVSFDFVAEVLLKFVASR